jgi:aspartyl protease family protein
MKNAFRSFGITTVILGITLAAPSVATDNQPSLSTDSVRPAFELAQVRRFPERLPQNQRVIRVPIQGRSGGVPIINVTFNGEYTFPMLVDTGASITTITSKMARAIGFRQEGKERATIANGQVIEFPIGRVRSIDVVVLQA